MSNFFNMDNSLWRFLGRLADVMILNIVFLITCLPVVTIGAAWTSLSYVTLKMSRDEESYIVKSYFKAFRQNFRQATAIWGIALVAMFIFYMDFHIVKNMDQSMAQMMFILLSAIALLFTLTLLYVFPVLAKFDNTIMGTIRNAFIMSILQLPKTLVMLVMAFFPLIIYLVSLRLIPIIFLFGFSLPAYASAMLYNKFFQKLEDQLLSEQEPAPEVSPEEDERVFHDEIDESIKIEDK